LHKEVETILAEIDRHGKMLLSLEEEVL